MSRSSRDPLVADTPISQRTMNKETCLQVQALADGELDASHRDRIAQLCAQDPEAARLAESIAALRAALQSHEPDHAVSESREFYWSRIRNRIETLEAAGARRRVPAGPSWLRWLAPVAGLATVLVGAALRKPDEPVSRTFAAMGSGTFPGELAQDTSVTYRSDADGVTVHWIP